MKTLLDEQHLREGVGRLGAEIEAAYAGRPLTVVGVMTGSVMFLADLLRQLSVPMRVGVVQARSYRDSTTPGGLVLSADFLPTIEDRDVLVVDDIFDTGETIAALVEELEKLGPRSVRSAVLLRKRGGDHPTIEPDYVGFTIPDVYVVGYGLDYRDAYRHLPYVAELESADIASLDASSM